MEKLIAKLAELGVNVNAEMGEDTVARIAQSMGIQPLDYMERQVKVVDYTNKRGQTNKFIETPAFNLGKDEKGNTKTTRGLFLRVEALDQAIADLAAARKLIVGDE